MGIEKICYVCNKAKRMEDFYRQPGMADGHSKKCKSCANYANKINRQKKKSYYSAYDKERDKTESRKRQHRASQVKYISDHPKRRIAVLMIGNAIRTGKIKSDPCFICGIEETEGHHPDYDVPLSVVWLCGIHHRQIHDEYKSI